MYDLAKKKEELMSKPPENVRKDKEEDASDIEDQEFEEFLDWRSKEAWKWKRIWVHWTMGELKWTLGDQEYMVTLPWCTLQREFEGS